MPVAARREVRVHVITTQQIALIAIVWVVAFASTAVRALRDGDRRSYLRLFGLGSTSGFFGVGLYCVGDVYIAGYLGPGGNLFWIGVASFLGFTATYQDKIGGEIFTALLSKILGGTIAILSAMKKDDR